jgi:hypothetical protein
MVEKIITPRRNVIDLARYQQYRVVGKAQVRICRHCGAALADGENEDECSSALNVGAVGSREATRKFYAE